MPQNIVVAGQAIPGWAVSLVTIALSILIALVAHWILFATVRRFTPVGHTLTGLLTPHLKGPARLAVLIVSVQVALALAPPPEGIAETVSYALTIALILLISWSVLRLLRIAADLYLRRFRLDSEDNLLARKHFTQVRILRRAAATVVVILTIAALLMTSEGVRQYGVSLLASAGAAGIILGLALQPLLTNLIAGIQIAVTQPIRIEDAVIVEGEWGWIEEINSTYVVVRLWDWRRMVVPLKYFIDHPFQNWTRHDAALIGSVKLYVDYDVPVEVVRSQLLEFLAASSAWDRKVANTQVTDSRENSIEIRLLMSARSAPAAWDLRCEIREKMIAFLRDNYPNSLPKRRVEALTGRALRSEA